MLRETDIEARKIRSKVTKGVFTWANAIIAIKKVLILKAHL
jgi:hypothetical protein